MSVKVDWNGTLEKLQKKIIITDKQLDELGELILIALADRYVELVQEKSPKKTGKYASEWKREEPEDNKISVTNPDGKLYNILEFTGRRKLHITPKNAKSLHFVIGGVDIFVMFSNPGATSPEPHARPALEDLGREAKKIVFDVTKKKFPMFK